MREDGEAAAAVDEFDRLGGAAHLGDVPGLPVGQVLVERLLDGGDHPFLDQRLGHVGPARIWPPPASASKSARVIGMPAARIFSTMRWFRLTRLSWRAARLRRSWGRGSQRRGRGGGTGRLRVVDAQFDAGTNSMSRARAAALASASPPIVSWSVTATARRPTFLARSTSSVGVREPSEAVVWLCKSIMGSVLGAVAGGLPGGRRGPGAVGRAEAGSATELYRLTGRRKYGMHKGFTLWFTGMSGAGKSTIAEHLVPSSAGAATRWRCWTATRSAPTSRRASASRKRTATPTFCGSATSRTCWPATA